MAPDDTDFFSSPHTDILIERLVYAMTTRKGFLLLTGEVGLGKTTLARRIVRLLEEHKVETALILHSFYQETQLLSAINKDFGIDDDDLTQTLTRQMELLNDFLLEKNKAGINCAIIIDDAQALSVKSLELVRIISNLEADQEKLVQVLLVGQTELTQTLQKSNLRQLKSRIAIWEEPAPLTRDQVQRYLEFKLNKAGDNGRIAIEKKALDKLYKLSGGNFRRINIIMDQALQHACRDQSLTIRKQYIEDVFIEEPDDAGSKKLSTFFSVFLLVTAILILGWVAGGYLFYTTKIKPLKQNPMTFSQPSHIVTGEIPDPADTLKTDPSPAPVSPVEPALQPQTPEETMTPDDPVYGFLEAYNLSSYRQAFSDALDANELEEVSRQILQETGLALVVLDGLPDDIRPLYHLLAIDDSPSQNARYCLFWKPSFLIPADFQGARGDEIEKLQIMLEDMGVYRYNIDGIAGDLTTRAVKAFQNAHDLEPTGYPDMNTLFLLTHLSRKGS